MYLGPVALGSLAIGLYLLGRPEAALITAVMASLLVAPLIDQFIPSSGEES
ncbi:hypothetical protein [Enterovirga rhinocerotis]|uniref:Uncharacterized protein n=1 Tax=Enterovirga rhinocerotis TaxID=1339210 RepID=A0A4R7BW06_9HYPH|nr:hypothetical protein [Enterovirga rhinocerotis]TDR89643.1 hypothetical protein EV668_2478 [Enterovirga rhinocerotis]